MLIRGEKKKGLQMKNKKNWLKQTWSISMKGRQLEQNFKHKHTSTILLFPLSTGYFKNELDTEAIKPWSSIFWTTHGVIPVLNR